MVMFAFGGTKMRVLILVQAGQRGLVARAYLLSLTFVSLLTRRIADVLVLYMAAMPSPLAWGLGLGTKHMLEGQLHNAMFWSMGVYSSPCSCPHVRCPVQTTSMASLQSLVDTSKVSLYLSLAAIAFNPTAWNIVARDGMQFTSHPTVHIHAS